VLDIDRIRYVETLRAPTVIGPYSQGALVSNSEFLFTSGQLPIDPVSGQLAGDTTAVQCEVALRNALEIVRAGGGDVSDVVKTVIYTTDLSQLEAINNACERVFDKHRPARSLVGVAAVPRGAKVEIELVAAPSTTIAMKDHVDDHEA